jgi:hypothetical protein
MADTENWATKKLPSNVWLVAMLIKSQLAQRGLNILPREFLIPKVCPRCRSAKITATDEVVRCTNCGYGRPNIANRGCGLTVGELVGLATELVHHAASGTLAARLQSLVAEPPQR